MAPCVPRKRGATRADLPVALGPRLRGDERRKLEVRYPPFFAFASSISFSSFGGDIGSELGLTPMH
jgi:hypothetical protein